MTNEYAWLAGIIEGEGYIDRKVRAGQKDAIRIRVKMTDEDVIARVAKMFESSYYPRPQPEGQKLQYETAITGKRALEILRTMEPLFSKRRKARIAELAGLSS